MRSLFAALVAALAFAQVAFASWSMQMANTSVWYSATASCGKSNYASHVWKGPTTGFVYTYGFTDLLTDQEGYVGYQASQNLIVVVYRGTESIENWIDDARFLLTTYPYCAGCEVHTGFYKAHQSVWSGVLAEVKRLRSKYTTYNLLVTGHSLGGAVATLAAMEFTVQGIPVKYAYTFGSPRVGNPSFGDYVGAKLPDMRRVTHYKDTVPHVPYESMGYRHVINEHYEDQNHGMHTCSGPEDTTTCCQQWSFVQTNTDDHVLYLNLDMHCAAVS